MVGCVISAGLSSQAKTRVDLHACVMHSSQHSRLIPHTSKQRRPGLVCTLDCCNDKQISLLLDHKAFSGLSVLCRSVSEDSVGVLYISICE